jgi:hypothetical protein
MTRFSRAGKRGLPGKRRLPESQGDLVADGIAAALYEAMVALDRDVEVEAGCWFVLDEEADVFGQCWPGVLEGEEVISSLGADRLGDVALTADNVDDDQRAGKLEAFEQQRDGLDLVGFGVDGLLAEAKPLPADPCRH